MNKQQYLKLEIIEACKNLDIVCFIEEQITNSGTFLYLQLVNDNSELTLDLKSEYVMYEWYRFANVVDLMRYLQTRGLNTIGIKQIHINKDESFSLNMFVTEVDMTSYTKLLKVVKDVIDRGINKSLWEQELRKTFRALQV